MNYRHAFHAGNHADVLKHIVLTRLIALMSRKEQPFAYIDTHAGLGLYDLQGDQASRTGEYLDCLLYTSPSPRDQRGSRMPSSA